jgi:hypothetical protein
MPTGNDQSQLGEWRVKHPVKGIKENLFALLKYVFADYAVQLRAEYPDRKIRKACDNLCPF